MEQILTVKYTKEEVTLVMIANSMGVLISIPLSLLIGCAIGLFNDLKSAAFSSTGWTMLMLEIGLIISPMCWVATILVCLALCRNEKREGSMPLRRMIPGTLLFPLGLVYAFIIMGLVIFPLIFLVFEYINRPLVGLIVGLLALLPFVVIGGAVILPQTLAGKALRRFLRRFKRSRGEEHRT